MIHPKQGKMQVFNIFVVHFQEQKYINSHWSYLSYNSKWRSIGKRNILLKTPSCCGREDPGLPKIISLLFKHRDIRLYSFGFKNEILQMATFICQALLQTISSVFLYPNIWALRGLQIWLSFKQMQSCSFQPLAVSIFYPETVPFRRNMK